MVTYFLNGAHGVIHVLERAEQAGLGYRYPLAANALAVWQVNCSIVREVYDFRDAPEASLGEQRVFVKRVRTSAACWDAFRIQSSDKPVARRAAERILIIQETKTVPKYPSQVGLL